MYLVITISNIEMEKREKIDYSYDKIRSLEEEYLVG